VHFGLANFPVAYCELKIITSLSLRFPDFQRCIDDSLPYTFLLGFKAFHSAQATIAGIETAHMIRKGQLSEENIPVYKQFMALAG
jgi:hypothetical protein